MRFHTAMRTPQSWMVACGGCELVSSLRGSQSKKEFTVGDKTHINRVIYWFFREGQLALQADRRGLFPQPSSEGNVYRLLGSMLPGGAGWDLSWSVNHASDGLEAGQLHRQKISTRG